MFLEHLANIAGGLVAGALTKKASKKGKLGQRVPAHKVGSPLSAAAGAAAVEGLRSLITGDPFNPDAVSAAALQDGSTAIAVHTIYKNGVQFVGSIKGLF